jgi:hypothetical protein
MLGGLGIAGGSTVTGGGDTTGGETVTVPGETVGGTTVVCVPGGVTTTVVPVGDVVVVVVVVVSPDLSPSLQATAIAPVLIIANARITGDHTFRYVISDPH